MLKQVEYADSMLRSNPLKAYEIAEEINVEEITQEEYLDVLNIKMKSLWLMSEYEKAFKITNEVLELAGDSDEWISQTLNIIGNIYFDLGNIDKALENYMKGLSIARRIKNRVREANLLNNIGEIYSNLDVYDDAIKYYSMSLDITKDMEGEIVTGIAQLNIGEIYYKQGNYTDAISMVKVSIGYFTQIEDYISIAIAHLALARISRAQNDITQAKKDLILSIDVLRRLHEKFNLLQAYETMIEILIEENNFEEALEYVEDAMDISEALGVKKEIAEIALYAADIYEKQKNYSKSLDYYKQYSEIRLVHEKEKEEELHKNISAQLNIEKAIHEKEIYRLRNVELRRKTEEIQKLYDDMQIINAIGQDITSTMDMTEIMYLLYDNLNKMMDASYFGIFQYDRETNKISTELFLEYGQPIKARYIDLENRDSVGAYCVREKRTIYTNNYDLEYEEYRESYIDESSQSHPTKSMMVVPLIIEGDIIGAITVQSTLRDAYKDYHFNLIEALASFIAIAIRNSQRSKTLSVEIEERIKTENQLVILNEKLSHMSYYDALTEIPNRRSFVEYFHRELSRAKRNKEVLSILIIDVDHFKEYNDNYGHVEGDHCLQMIAKLLKKVLKREIDFVARYGGDEFVAVMSDTEYDGAYQIAQQMSLFVREAEIEHKYSPIEDIITLTIGGISVIPEYEDTMELIIQEADKALYRAKDMGRNQVCFYNDMEKEN